MALYKYELKLYREEWENRKKDLDICKESLHNIINDIDSAKEKREYEEYKLEECKKDLQAALDTYHDITDNKLREIDTTIEE